MTQETIAVIILVGVFLGLLICRCSVAVSMGLAAAATYLYLDLPMELIVQYTVGGVSNFTFMAVPFFILSGELINQGGIGDRLVDLANELVGWMHGGSAMVNVLASVFFGGVSGSAPADIAALGPLEAKLMMGQGFTHEFATGLTCATAVQGMLIPPSHNMVIYAVTAGVSVGAMFTAGLPAGLFLAGVLGVYSYIYARVKGYKSNKSFNFKRLGKAAFAGMGGIMTIVIIFVGVSAGIMTATESAAIAVLWSFICAFFLYRDVPLTKYYEIATASVKTLSTIMILLAIANAFGWILAYLRIPNMIAKAVLSLTSNKFLIVLLIHAVILFLGCFMSISSILLIVTPIVVPILKTLDYSLVQFGVSMILNLGVGLLTPPVGAALYTASAVSGIKIGKLTRVMLPFYGLMVLTLFGLMFIPMPFY